MLRVSFVSAVLVGILSSFSMPQPVLGSDTDPEPAASEATKEQKAKEDQALREFAGLRLGVGLSFTVNVTDQDRIGEADVVNGIVRVKSETNNVARIMLETHYFITRNKCRAFGITLSDEPCGAGPFVAIQPGSQELIEAIGAGLMFGFRRAKDSSDSFNIGLGIICDPNVKVLGDGLVANEPLPEGDSLRYKQTSAWGVLFISSFSF